MFIGMISSRRAKRIGLLQTTALVLTFGASQGFAQSSVDGFAATGFSISLNDTLLSGATLPNSNRQADLLAYALDIDIRYDGLDTRQFLNVATTDLRMAYRGGETVTFNSSSNYPAFIQQAEIRIIDLGRRGYPVLAKLNTASNGVANWTMPADGSGNYAYVLRVYDAAGRYDETVPVALNRARNVFETQAMGTPLAAGLGADNTARRGIPVRGGLITASGSGATPNGTVMVMGEAVAVDGAGRFVTSRILPVGDHVVQVSAAGRDIVRDVEIPASEWFHVGIVDITAGWRFGNINPGDYVNGRVAFYVKGQTASGWTITSSLDTGDGPISGLLSRLDDKDPQRVLDRLRSDAGNLYPTYGDDSSYFDDTPTSGRIYLQAENENFRFTWGDFTAGVSSASLLQNTRDLYGAELRYRSTATTDQGEARMAASLYAAQPDTLAQRDILRGTGGSVYFLSHQDINGGSVNLSVQVVDINTGRVISTSPMQQGVDYTIDHLQGMLLLTSPLTSSASGAGVVSSGADYVVNIVAAYEYTPTTTAVDDQALGAHGEVWLGNRLRFGATVMQDETAAGTQRLASVDLRYQASETSYAELEFARSDGPGLGYSTSTDGGLTFFTSTGVATPGAQAIHFDSRLDLRDIGLQSDGFIGVYYEQKDAGFATLAEDITFDQSLLGVEAEIALGERLTFGFDAEQFSRANGDERIEGEVRVAFAMSDRLSLEAGVQFVDKTTIGVPTETGQRTDVGLRVSYAPTEVSEFYVFGQATLNVAGGLSSNNRYGAGFNTQLNERLSFGGEYSTGDAGDGGFARLTYTATAQNEVYIGYTLDPTRSGAGGALADNGRIVLGGRYQLSDSISTYTESVFDLPDNQRSLTQIYGVNYTPSEAWTLATTVEIGTITDSVDGDFDRLALSFGVAHDNGNDQSWRARFEYRDENGVGTTRDRTTYALSAGYANSLNDNWRILADTDVLLSESAEGDFRDGRYIRASLGYAYRPVDNEKLNILLRYTYLNDQPGEDQISADGTANGPLQISNVFSMSASYDLSNALTLGGKIGYRMAQVAPRGTTAFTSNTATLGVIGADWHIVNNWDISGEARLMYTAETGTYETGAMAAIYRHLGEHVKLGLGYEFGAVSDSLAVIDYSGQGVFLNLVAKY